MSSEEIERLIPHRPPMRLLDEIVSRDETTIVCRKTFRPGEFFVQGHFPAAPLVPGVIQCECCLQAGAILLAEQTQSASAARDGGVVPVATRLDSVRFKRMVRPGDTVEVQVTLKDRVSNAYYLTGKMLVDGKLAARLDFACSVTSPLHPAEDAAAGVGD
jgi:3-hydroxyacyl-[acyl-carrier-protein] dehydratase